MLTVWRCSRKLGISACPKSTPYSSWHYFAFGTRAEIGFWHTRKLSSICDPTPQSTKQLGFEVIRQQALDEYKSSAVLYRHCKTGAEVISMTNEDENKVFGIVLRTPPSDSSGIPHILEHSVLCGSRKYPVKQPFTEVLKTSLHTFLNAISYPDRTCYSVATTNTKDLYNLIDVCLDAVFFPKCVIDKEIFRQKGWHYQLNDSKDVILGGLVYEMMKEVYSRPDNALGRVSQQALFPDTVYRLDSGGDPAVIPTLTYSKFQDFHRKFYHPSNARLWFYGDDDPVERLHLINAYLDEFDASTSAKESRIRAQLPFSQPKRVVDAYVMHDGESLRGKNMVCVNWMLGDMTQDTDTELALGILDHLMLGTHTSLLRKALKESGLGEAVVGSGLDIEMLQPQFSVGLKNVGAGGARKVEELLISKLREFAEEGFTLESVEGALNTYELSLRENKHRVYPRGLCLMLQTVRKWLYGGDPFEPLRFRKNIDSLRAKIAAEGSEAVFSPLIRKHFLDNPHRVTVLLQPDPLKGEADELREKKMLRTFKSTLKKEDLAELRRANDALRLKQETPDTPEALTTVPSLSLDDISKEPFYVPLEVGTIEGTSVLQHDLFTNGVLYADVAFDTRAIESRLVPLLPLFCKSLMEMGTKTLDSARLKELINGKTGGIDISLTSSAVRRGKEASGHMILRGKALGSQVQDLFETMRILLHEVQMSDEKWFKQLLFQSKARLEYVLRNSGHKIASLRMNAKFNMAGWVAEQMGGLSHFDYLQRLEKQVDTDWSSVVDALESIRHALLCRKRMVVNLTADNKLITRAEPHVLSLVHTLTTQNVFSNAAWTGHLDRLNEGVVVPTEVNHVGKAINIYDVGYKLHGSAHVICKYVQDTWLWDHITEIGGASGSFCEFDAQSGVLSFSSFQDPSVLDTLNIYDQAVQFLGSLQLNKDSLKRAIIGTIGSIDPYELPDAKGYTSMLRYLRGISEEERKLRREEILTTRLHDFHDLADVLAAAMETSVVVVVGCGRDIAAANKKKPGILHVKKVL